MPFFDALLSWTTELDMLLWGPGMLALLLGTHVYLTIRTRGVQFVHFWPAVKLLFSREARSAKGRGDVSPFAALMTALAGTVGNGNKSWQRVRAVLRYAALHCTASPRWSEDWTRR